MILNFLLLGFLLSLWFWIQLVCLIHYTDTKTFLHVHFILRENDCKMIWNNWEISSSIHRIRLMIFFSLSTIIVFLKVLSVEKNLIYYLQLSFHMYLPGILFSHTNGNKSSFYHLYNFRLTNILNERYSCFDNWV